MQRVPLGLCAPRQESQGRRQPLTKSTMTKSSWVWPLLPPLEPSECRLPWSADPVPGESGGFTWCRTRQEPFTVQGLGGTRPGLQVPQQWGTANSLRRDRDMPRRDRYYVTGNLRLTMGSTSSSSKFLGANIAKGMSKLVKVTLRVTEENISSCPSPSPQASVDAARSLGAQQVHTPADHTAPQAPLVETPQFPTSPITGLQHKQGLGLPKAPEIQLWKLGPQ